MREGITLVIIVPGFEDISIWLWIRDETGLETPSCVYTYDSKGQSGWSVAKALSSTRGMSGSKTNTG